LRLAQKRKALKMLSKQFSVCLAFVCCTFLAAEEIIIEPQKAGINIGAPSMRNGGCFCAPAVLDEKPATRVDYNAFETKWLEFCTSRFLLKNDISEFIVEVDFFLPEANMISEVNLRVIDKDDETTQLMAKVPEDTKGWITLNFKVRPEDGMKSSWGPKGKTNRKFDRPIYISGFSCYYKVLDRTGYIGVGKIKIVTP